MSLTFKYLIFLKFLLDMPELSGLPYVDTGLGLSEFAEMHFPLLLVPLPLQELATNRDRPIHHTKSQVVRLISHTFLFS